ncbi:hypothetical protein AVI51_15370 [Piscirickettsia salmonis]|uniref:Uncharacterized protein n=1 Tax=Piscirickettsia salmonis TaxID=1238 RepID=A0A9Q5V814_PISSA|nr:hypothetical protein [Piscirickettsia salmonis]ALA24412.1 Peptidase, family S24 [Piscirickettsia salmonis]APS44777.1 hypothetical protein AVI48_10655 [Piscirickettsia salmonis]APS48136.1 hypothetical protein AVI49_11260 [Piscirickettsia salmonis]APS55311.1 hypothetical protein AVI51_15370 [Piscirickettsia salmonis]APS58439.1 hypothetical protein AVI52_15135 [Piscirickettsia salmonis]
MISWSNGLIKKEYIKWVNTELAVSDKSFAIESGYNDLVNSIQHNSTIQIIDLKVLPKHHDYALVTEKPNQKKPALRQILIDGDDIYLKPVIEGLGSITFCKNPTFYGCVVQTIVNY